MDSADNSRARTLHTAFSKTADAVFNPFHIQDVKECFPRIVDNEYHEELHRLLSEVLQHHKELVKGEFQEICSAAQVSQGLRNLEQLCTAQGVTGSGSAATVTWNPDHGPSPLALAREQRVIEKNAEKARLIAELEKVHVETQATAVDLQEKRKAASALLTNLDGATASLHSVQNATANLSNQMTTGATSV